MFNQLSDQFKSIQLNIYDKIAIVLYFTLIIGYFLGDQISILTVGGLLIIGGSFFTYKGKMLVAVVWYLIADVCWILNAASNNDWHGTFFITIGIIFGALATFKMKSGKMESELQHKNQ